MGGKIFTEENQVYQIDLKNTINAIGDLHEKYQSIGNFLSDVDFIAETEQNVFLIEYKNTDIENATNPYAFNEKISNGKFQNSILKKYFGSVFYVLSTSIAKNINYIVILECKNACSSDRKRIKASIKKTLPYKLQEINDINVKLIDEFDILSIDEWNSHKLYSRFPISKVAPPLHRV